MSLEDQIRSLKAIGSFKDAVRDEVAIRQYIANARHYRDDAERARSALARFTLAYEALFALATAFLIFHESRTSGEGHRSMALQLGIVELTWGSNLSGIGEAIVQIHRARNETTYFRPVPPVSKKLADATLKLLVAALDGAATITGALEDPRTL